MTKAAQLKCYKNILYLLMAALTALLLSARQQEELKQWVITGQAQGTAYRLQYYAADNILKKQEVDHLLNALDSSVSVYKSYSLITQFNNSSRGGRMDKHFRLLINKSSVIHKETGGLVDITVKPLVDAWGFGAVPANSDPTAADISAILRYVGQEKIFLKGDSLIKSNPKTQVDINGIGQGYAVDLIAEMLEAKGIVNYLVELGGELRIKGQKPDDRPFRVGIASAGPKSVREEAMQTIVIPRDGAVTTSGNYVHYRMSGNKKISHIINPKTGMPVSNEIISVTVWAKDAITADGYDNGLMAMGLKAALQFLQNRKDMGAYIIYQKPDGSIADTASAYFWEQVKKAKQ